VNSEYQAQVIVNIIKIFLKKVIFQGQTLSMPYSITKSRRSIDLSKNKSKKPNGGAVCGKIVEVILDITGIRSIVY
jgi:predicted outer membrane repeat protein